MSFVTVVGRSALGFVAALVALGASASSAAAHSPPPEDARRVIVVSVPGFTWRDVQRDRPPTVLELARAGAVASTSLRTVGRTTSPAEAYLTLGAGKRAAAGPGADPSTGGLVLPPDAPFEGDTAGAVAARRTGADTGGAAGVVPAIAAIRRASERSNFKAEPGLLVERLAAAGRSMAVVANGDAALGAPPERSHREAGLAGIDSVGRVAAGALGGDLLMADPRAAEGVRMNPHAVEAAFATAVDEHDVVLVELSDIWRATRFADVALWDAYLAARTRAIADTDALLSRLLAHVDLSQDLVVVVSPVSPVVGGSDQLTVGLLAGRGVEPGLLRSGTTRRAGYVTLPDVAPTVLRALGQPVPTAMSGAPMSVRGGDAPGASTVRDLIGDNKQALFRNEATGPLTMALIVVQVVGYVLAAVALRRGWRAWFRALMALALLTSAVPLVAYVSGLTPYRALGVSGYVVAVFVAAAVVALAALGVAKLGERRGMTGSFLLAPLVIAGLTAVTLLVDVAVGAPLQVATPFGYGGGPLVAGRFSGYGNLSTGLLAQSLVIGVTAAWGMRSRSVTARWDRPLLVVAATLFGLAVIAIGAPQLGQDVGGVLSVLPGFVLVVLLAAGVSLTWRRVLATGVGTLAVLGFFGAVDLLRPAEQRTHLGRLLQSIADQGPAALAEVIARKLSSNAHALTTSVWGLLIPASVAFLVVLARSRRLRDLEESVPGLRLCLLGTLALCVLGGTLNDSGIAIPSFMLVLALPYVSYLALHRSAATGR